MPDIAATTLFVANFQQWAGIILDILVLIGVLSLWLLWKRTIARQKHAETILKETAEQLEIATETLDEALEKIAALKRKNSTASGRDQPSVRKKSLAEAGKSGQPTKNQLNRILEMSARGDSPASISRALEIPEAKIRLTLKLQQNRSSQNRSTPRI